MSENSFITIPLSLNPAQAGPPSEPAALTNLLALIQAARAIARHVSEGDPLAIDELHEALAIAEIGVLRLSAEHALAGAC